MGIEGARREDTGPIRRLRGMIRRWGLYRRLRRLAGRILMPLRIARLYLMYRKDLRRPMERFRARVPVEIATAEPDEIEAAARINRGATEDLPRLYRERQDKGGVCFVARAKDRIVAYNWLITRPLVDFDGERIELREGEIFCLDAYTAEPWRGNGIHTELLSRMLEWARDQGYQTAWTEVSAVLRRSWKTHQRLDWELTGRILHVRGFWGLRPRLWRLTGSAYPVAGLDPGYEGW